MKRRLTLVIVLFIALFLSACESSKITGNWELQGYWIRATGEYVDKDDIDTVDIAVDLSSVNDATMTLSPNGKFHLVFPGLETVGLDTEINGTYKVTGNVISVYNPGEDTPSLKLEIVGDTIELPMLYDVTPIFTKK